MYYALVRALRPKHVVVIGSGFGFSVVRLALGLKDHANGRLAFVDPSYSLLTDGPQWNAVCYVACLPSSFSRARRLASNTR